MRRYSDSVASSITGLPVLNAQVRVLNGDGSAATVYSDDGVTVMAQPVLTDSLGSFYFYVSDGIYTLTIDYPGSPTRTIPGIEIFSDVNDARAVLVQDGEDQPILPAIPDNDKYIVRRADGTLDYVDSQAVNIVNAIGEATDKAISQKAATDAISNKYDASNPNDFVDAAAAITAVSGVLSGDDGAGMVGFVHDGDGAVARTVQSKLRDTISVMDFGAIGDGITDDSSAIAAATVAAGSSGSILLPPASKLSVSSWDNPFGIRATGGGKIVIGTGSAAYSADTYARGMGFVFGRENADALFNQANTAGSTLNGFFYGDSTVATTANGGIPGGPNTPDVLLSDYFRTHGVRNPIIFTNRAVGGTNWSQANPVPDVSTTTKLMVFKYGINHVSGQDVAAEINAMRTVLASVRAQTNGAWDKLTIILVSPTSTHDTVGGRTNLWYEQLRDAYTRAAWDYGCVYVDVYGLFPDSRRWAGFYSDTPAVHQQDLLRQQVWAYVGQAILPPGALHLSTGNRWVNLGFDGTTNGWGNYGVGTDPASASLSEDGWVRLRGGLTRASGAAASSQRMAILPNTNYYPTGSKFFDVLTYDGTNWTRAPIGVETDGTIITRDLNMKNTLVALDGLAWRVW